MLSKVFIQKQYFSLNIFLHLFSPEGLDLWRQY